MSEIISARAARRSFLTRLGAGVSGLAATAAATGVLSAQGQSGAGANWQPARHDKDDWLDKPSSKHRLIFDTTTAVGFGEALAFAGNFIRVNQTDYNVPNSDLSVVIVVRHNSTAFGYNDAMWKKYGMPLAVRTGFTDPKTNEAPKANLFRSPEYGVQLPNRGTTVDSLMGQGLQLAVCQVATRGIATALAQATGGETDQIYNELMANIITNARMVPAGIVAVSRAQERGYTFARS